MGGVTWISTDSLFASLFPDNLISHSDHECQSHTEITALIGTNEVTHLAQEYHSFGLQLYYLPLCGLATAKLL